MHKVALRTHLYVEQYHLCVYCETEIYEGHQQPHIDHWRPLRFNLHDVFKWDNLHLSCATPYSCDCNKKDNPLKGIPTDPDLPWPSQFAYEDVLGYTSGGRVYVRNDVTILLTVRRGLDLAIKAILNLNSYALREARAAAIEDEEKGLLFDNGGQPTTPQQRQCRAHALLAAARRPGFVSIRVALLMGTLGTGR